MARAVAGGLVLALLCTSAIGQDVPDGVRYVPAAAEINTKAENLLRGGLASQPYRLAQLGTTTASPPLLVGPFLSGSLVQAGVATPDEFVSARYSIPLSADVKPEMPAIGAASLPQRAALDAALTKEIARGSPKIRKMKPEEMALIWFYIGWDITEPVFTVEQAGRTLVVDFDEAGESVTWIEDISQPCFRVLWDGGGLKECFCSKTVRQGNRYGVVFQPTEVIASCVPAGRPTRRE